jgi:ketosteroid isomerase-like protein
MLRFALAFVVALTMAPSGEDELRQLSSDWDEALRRRNAHAVGRLLAEEYTFTDENGTVFTKAGYLMAVAKTPDRAAHTEFASVDVAVTVAGDTATVTGRSPLKTRRLGRSPSDAFAFTDKWVKKQGVWRAVSTTVARVAP